jgi:hypothetical protein
LIHVHLRFHFFFSAKSSGSHDQAMFRWKRAWNSQAHDYAENSWMLLRFYAKHSMNKKETSRGPSSIRRRQLAALKRESEHEMAELIRRRLAMPVERRTNFLRVKLPLPMGGSCL